MVTFFYSMYLSDIETSNLRFKNVAELLKVRKHHSFLSVVASSSCVITIIQTFDEDEFLDAIDMMNGFRAERKHLLLLVPTFDEKLFKNITINYAVTIKHSDGGDVNINILQQNHYNRFNSL